MTTDEVLNVSVLENTSDTYQSLTNWTNWYTAPYTISWSTTVYLYQVRCPKRGCRKMNWLQLETVTPCAGCGSKLRAYKESTAADFDIPVG